MSSLRSIDLEELNGLVDFIRGRGYVLNFSDATYSQFFLREVEVNINDPCYADLGGSKGKRLRRFLQLSDDRTALKLVKALWEHRAAHLRRSRERDPIPNADARYRALLERLGEKPAATSTESRRNTNRNLNADRLVSLKTEIVRITTLSPQPRGYAFEKFLKDLFDAYGMEARQAFRNQGEQIDGGIVIDGDKAAEISDQMNALRGRFWINRLFKLKFNPAPPNLDHKQFISVKQTVIELAQKYDIRLMVYVVLHDLATNPDAARRDGINTVCYHFDCVLNHIKQPGLVLIDRFNDAGNQIDGHLVEKFSVGVAGLPYSPEMRLANIVGFHYSAVGQSHFPSMLDILVGSLRFSIDAHTRHESKNLASAGRLLKMLSPLFFRDAAGLVPELGFTFSPKTIKSPSIGTVMSDSRRFSRKME